MPGRVQERHIGHSPGLGVLAPQHPDLVRAQPGCAQAQVGGYRPEVANKVGVPKQRPCPAEGLDQLRVLRKRPAEHVLRDVVSVVVLV
ncbi:hypothetical protein D9M72_532130 [compost metagenome]